MGGVNLGLLSDKEIAMLAAFFGHQDGPETDSDYDRDSKDHVDYA